MSASQTKPKRDFVKEAAKMKINKQSIKKQYQPGIYTQHHPSQCEHMLKNRPIHLKLESATELKEMVKIVTQDNIRQLLVPSDTINVYPTIWPSNELGRIKEAGHIVTKEAYRQHLQQIEEERQRKARECEERKKYLRDLDRKRYGASGEKKVEEEPDDDEDSAHRVLDRAFVSKQEQSEEVKRANRLIMAAKCHVIRDAQVAEKHELDRELREEEERLEHLMRAEHDKALRMEDIRREEDEKKRHKHSLEIKCQLRERELAKLRESERIEEEAKAMAQGQIAITLDMLEKEKERQQQILKVRNELRRSNEMSEYFKSMAFEEQRIADLKAAEFMRQKQARDQQLAAERRFAKEQKQRESDRLLAQQIKAMDSRNDQEEKNMRREQEAVEREFRRKEKEAAMEKVKRSKALEAARMAQTEQIKRERAMNILREEVDFQGTVEQLRQAAERERLAQQKKMEAREKYRLDIMNQIKDNEMARRASKNTEMKVFAQEQQKDEQRAKDIQTVINAKLNMMRNANIPDKFIQDVERQLHSKKKLTEH